MPIFLDGAVETFNTFNTAQQLALPDKPDMLYRAWASSEGDYIDFEPYPIRRRTPKGAWIDSGRPRFVNLEARKQWASSTKREALRQLYFRMQSWENILRTQLDRARSAQALAKKLM